MGMPPAYISVGIMLLLGIVMLYVAVGLSRWLAPRAVTKEKLTSYECGEETVGSSRGPVDIQYYLYVLVFLILDIEAVFLIPFVLEFRELGTTAIIEMVIFVVMLLFGWAYAIRKGALTWQKA